MRMFVLFLTNISKIAKKHADNSFSFVVSYKITEIG